VDKLGIETGTSSNLANITVFGSSTVAPLSPLPGSEDAEGLFMPLCPLRVDCMLCVRGRVLLEELYSARLAKL